MDSDIVVAEHEYTTSVELLKHYATIQFAQLSVFLLFMVAVVSFLLDRTPTKSDLPWLVHLGTTVFGVCFLVMNLSHALIVNQLLRRTVALEEKLGYESLQRIKGIRIWWNRPTTGALLVMNSLFIIFCIANWLGCMGY